MTSVLQFRRGNTAQNNSFTGAVAEISIDTSTNTLRVHNAVTPGGTFIMPTLRLTNAERLTTTAQIGQFIYVTDYASAGVAPTWVGDGTTAGGVVAAGGVVSAASTASNLSAGTAGQIPYQTGPGVTSFFGPGSAGQLLLSNGTSAPSFTSTLTLSGSTVRVNGTTNATSTSTGALIVAGGIGVAGDVYVGGKIVSQQLEIQLTTVTTTLIQTDDVIKTSNATAAHNATSGALQIGGGIGVGGSIFVTGNVTATTFFGNLTGTASTATAAATAYSTIGTHTAGTGLSGTAFNGSANQTWTLNTSTLMATAVNLNGGVAGSLPYQSAAGATSFLGIGANGFVLSSNGSTPVWSALSGLTAGNATTASNIASGTAGQLVYQVSPGSTNFVSTATTGNFLQANFTGAPTWTTTASMYVNSAVFAEDVRGGTAGAVVYQSAANATDFTTTATTGNFLQANFNGAPTWTTTASMYVQNANVSTNLRSGAPYQIPYQSAANTTAFANSGTTGQFWQATTNGAPTWTTTASMYVNSAVYAEDVYGGTAGQLVYQSAPNTTAFAGPGSYGQFLMSTGASAPVYQSTLTQASGNIFITSNDRAFSTLTGALQIVNGGIGVGGSIYVGTTATAASFRVNTGGAVVNDLVIGNGTITKNGGSITITGGSNGSPSISGASGLVAGNNGPLDLYSGFGGNINLRTAANHQTVVVSNSATVSTSSGALQIQNGGLGVGGGVFVGGVVTATAFVGNLTGNATSANTASNLSGGAAGSVPYQTAGGATTFLGIGTNGFVLTSNGSTPVWNALSGLSAGNATTATNLANGDAGQIPYQSGVGATTFLGTATTGNFLQANFNGAPLWTSSGTMYVNSAVYAEDVYGGTAGQLVYQSAPNTTAFVNTAATGNFLQANSTGAPTWTTTANIYVNSAVYTEDVYGGTAGQIVYQSAPNTTAFAGPGTAGQLLVSGGTSAPTYANTSSIYIQDSNVSTNIRGGTPYQIPYQSAANTTAFANSGTTGQFWQATTNGAPTWTTTANIYVANAAISTNLRSGAAGSLPYQTAANATGFVSIAAAGNMLVSTGSTPSWVGTSSIYVNRATIADTILTAQQPASANYYPTFVDANNASASTELVWTTSTFYINPASGATNLQSLSINSLSADTGTKTSNALYVAGGAWIDKTLLVAGDATFRGNVIFQGTNTFVYSSSTVYTDNLISLHAPSGSAPGSHTWTIDDGKDIGFMFHYYKTTDKDAFLGFANDTGYLEWYDNGTESGGVFAGSSYGTFKTGAVKLVGGTANAGNTSTGDLTVLGGVGVGGSVYVGGNITVAGTINASITGITTTATNISGGTAGQFPYQTAPGVTSFVTTATTGNFLQANFTGAPTWTTTANIYVANAVLATHQRGGVAGQLQYQSAVDTTAFISTATTGNFLQSNFNGAPTWTTTANIYVNRATIADSATTATSAGTAYATIASHTAGTGLSGTTFNGSTAVTWTLNTATLMQTATRVVGALTAGAGLTGTSYDGSAAVTWTLNTATYMASAVTANNLAGGSAGQFAYQTGAGATSFASTGSMYVGRAVIADSASGGSAQVNTVAQPLSANNFLTFVDSNNASAAAESVYTTSSVYVNPASGTLTAGIVASTNNGSGTNFKVGDDAWIGDINTADTISLRGQQNPNNGYIVFGDVNTTALGRAGSGALTYGGNVVVHGGNTSTTYVGRAVLADSSTLATTATSAGTAYATIAAHTAGTGLSGTTFNGSTAVTWTLNTATYMASAVTANNLAAGAAGSLPYQSSAGATTFLGIGTNGYVLQSNGTSPAWVALSGLSTGNATNADNLRTIIQTASGTYYPSFVDSNNASAAYETHYTTSSFTINPSNGIVTVASGFTVAKNGTDSLITFPAQTNDPGFIKHTESSNTAAMQFSVSDDNGTTDYFGFGSSSALDTFKIWSNGTVAAGTWQGSSISTTYTDAKVTAVNTGTGLYGTAATGAVTLSLNTSTLMLASSNLAGGTAMSIHYQSAANTTAFLAAGTAGQVLSTNGTGSAPAWVNASGLTAGIASQVNTVAQPLSATYYPTFVDANNAAAAAESVYTTSTFTINPGTRLVGIGGNLMIGTGTPGAPLSFTDSLETKIQLNANAANSYTIGKAAAVNSGDSMTKFVAGATSAGEFGFYNTTNLRLLINNNGAVLINRSSQVGTTRLHVTGGTNTTEFVARLGKGNYADTGGHTTLIGFSCEDSGWAKTAIGHTRTGSYDTGYFGIYVSSDALSSADVSTSTHIRAKFSTSGLELANSLGVGTAASGTTGEIRATNEITAYYSDRRLKENVQVIGDAVTKVLSLNGITYTPNDLAESFGYDKTVKLVGLFADEVEAVLPEATRPAPFDQDESGNSISGENYKTIQYEKIVPLLVEAIKEQERTIQSLKAELNDIKNQLGK